MRSSWRYINLNPAVPHADHLMGEASRRAVTARRESGDACQTPQRVDCMVSAARQASCWASKAASRQFTMNRRVRAAIIRGNSPVLLRHWVPTPCPPTAE